MEKETLDVYIYISRSNGQEELIYKLKENENYLSFVKKAKQELKENEFVYVEFK